MLKTNDKYISPASEILDLMSEGLLCGSLVVDEESGNEDLILKDGIW